MPFISISLYSLIAHLGFLGQEKEVKTIECTAADWMSVFGIGQLTQKTIGL